MKILYAIQGTGNGHLSRARDIVPLLQQHADVDLLVSGCQVDVSLPWPVKYRLSGLSFIFGKSGGVDLWKTFLKCDSKQLLKDIFSLPIEQYNLIINDFEPVSAWAAKLKGIKCVTLSHQAAVTHIAAPKPAHFDPLGKLIMRYYAPVSGGFGFHFAPYAEGIFTPVIRKQVREAKIKNLGHITVYLPAFADQYLIKKLRKLKGIQWEIFSKHTAVTYHDKNISVYPINNEQFLQSMAASGGVLCGAGFETPAEALFLGKKLLVVPMKKQYEQHCNAAALAKMGVPVLPSLKKKYLHLLQNWLSSDEKTTVQYPDKTAEIIEQLLVRYAYQTKPQTERKPAFLLRQMELMLQNTSL